MAIGAIAGLIGGMGMDFGSSAYAIHQARRNFKHRYQWTMQDMRKAGLNPMLAASMGGGQAPPVASPELGKSAMNSAMTVSNLKTQQRQQENLYSDTFKKQTEEATSRALGDLHEANTRNLNVNTGLALTKMPRAASDKRFDASKPGGYLRWINRASRALQGQHN